MEFRGSVFISYDVENRWTQKVILVCLVFYNTSRLASWFTISIHIPDTKKISNRMTMGQSGPQTKNHENPC